MRADLKFRVWDKIDLTFIKQDYLIDYFCINANGDLCFSDEGNGTLHTMDESRYIVQRCSGLKDGDGNLMYDGDILKYAYHLKNDRIHIFKFNPFFASWALHMTNTDRFNVSINTSPLIVGNIFEDPELIAL